MIRVFLSGAHARRSPFSYAALAPLFEGAVTLTDRPADADLHLFAHSMDLEAAPLELVEDWRARRRPVVLLSEEPFWDTIWGRRPLRRHLAIETAWGALPVTQLNHATSPIFAYDRIPYYLLTNTRFAESYAARFTRNAARSPAEWREAFAARPARLTFMFERRPEPYHDVRWEEAGLIGLCAWRTRIAESFAPGEAERLGRSWQGGPSRFELTDWYGDKMARLDGHMQLLAAFENTHHPLYLTEKLFDAFACGALPLYFAAPDHRVHDLGLPPESWLNLHDLSSEAATALVRGWHPGPDFFEAFAAAQQRLAALMGRPEAYAAERVRLRGAVLAELTAVLDGAG